MTATKFPQSIRRSDTRDRRCEGRAVDRTILASGKSGRGGCAEALRGFAIERNLSWRRLSLMTDAIERVSSRRRGRHHERTRS